MATLWLERSCLARASGSSFIIRTNMVGTHWLWVTPYFSIRARACSASNRSIITTVPPKDWTLST